MHDLKSDLSSGLRTIALISVLATVALTVLAYSVSRVFVGEFPATVALGNVVIASMIGLVPFSFVYMMQRAYYALEDTRTPFFFTLIQIGLHITASVTLAFLAPAEYLVVGLALITSTTVTVQSVLAYRWLTQRIGSLREFGIARSTLVVVAAGLITGFLGWAVLQLFGGVHEGAFAVQSVLSAVVTAGVVGVVMLLVYGVLLKLFRVPEVDVVFARLNQAVARLRGIDRR